jgi:hypothetical protein
MCHDFYGELKPLSKMLLLDAATKLKSDNDTPKTLSEKVSYYYNYTLTNEQDEVFDFIEDNWSVICD